MAFVSSDWGDEQVIVCRSGYTGEHGYELLPHWDSTGRLWDALLAAAAPLGGRPAGLGARDTLRTEMGYPLHSQDLSLNITPVQARSSWAVGWDKQRVWGRDGQVAEGERGGARLLWGLEALDRGIPRPHMVVTAAAGEQAGEPVGELSLIHISEPTRLGMISY